MCSGKLFSAAVAMIVLFPIMSHGAAAIGLSPAYIVEDFQPGLNKSYTFRVRSTADVPVMVKASTNGELAKYITLSQDTFENMMPDEKRNFVLTLTLPEKMERPGLIVAYLEVSEIGPSEEGVLSAFTAVDAPIWVRVPYPGKYLDVDFYVSNVMVSQPVNISLVFFSRGQEDVTADSIVTISDSGGRKIGTLYINNIFVPALNTTSANALWSSEGNPPGIYRANMTVEYGGEAPVTKTMDFKIGDRLIKITNVTAKDIIRGDIIKFVLTLDSIWNGAIENVYVDLEVINQNGRVVGNEKSIDIDFKPWEQRNLEMYWDTGENDAGEYTARFTVHFDEKTSESSYTFHILSESAGYLMYALIIAVAIAVPLIFIIYRRRKRKRR